MEIRYRNISELKFAEYNPRVINEQELELLKASLSDFGIIEPAVVNMNPDRTNTVVGGEQRLHAAQALGHTTFPCIEVNLSEKDEMELNVRLNKNKGKFDYPKLFAEFAHEDLLKAGFSEDELTAITNDLDSLPKLVDKPLVLTYDIVFETVLQQLKFKSALSTITQQVKRTEQTEDLVNHLTNGK